jgi:large subunit ribosomal protein L18
MAKIKTKAQGRHRRHDRLRQIIVGTTARPRLAVFRSNKDIYVQIIDDSTGKTLVSTSSQVLKLDNGGNVAAATIVGTEIAKLALAANIKVVVFDRGGNIYHGRVKAIAEAAREAGLEI